RQLCELLILLKPPFIGGHNPSSMTPLPLSNGQLLEIDPSRQIPVVYFPKVIAQQRDRQGVTLDLPDNLFEVTLASIRPDEGPEQGSTIPNAEVLQLQLEHAAHLLLVAILEAMEVREWHAGGNHTQALPVIRVGQLLK